MPLDLKAKLNSRKTINEYGQSQKNGVAIEIDKKLDASVQNNKTKRTPKGIIHAVFEVPTM